MTKKFSVEVNRTLTQFAFINVEAGDEEEAEELANKELRRRDFEPDWELSDRGRTEVIEATEITD